MTQLAILSGIYGKASADFERSVPINLDPIAEPGDGTGTGISKGYLRLTYGVRTVLDAGGQDRGGYVWQGRHLRVIGAQLVEVNGGAVSPIGNVGDNGQPVQFAEGFGRVGIASNEQLFYYDGTALTRVTDPDLGQALAVAWSDGYFLTTDGDFIVATELNDPAAVDPLKYGSSEADPDPVLGILALRGDVYAVNRYTIEKFVNGGTTGFPFQRSRGSQIPKGAVGRQAYCPFVETFAFCGSARNETPSVYLAGAGQAIPIATRALATAIAALTDEQQATIRLEAITASGLQMLMVHLPTETWVYHWTASQLLDIPVWSRRLGGVQLVQPYPVRNHTLVGQDWWCSSGTKLGIVDPAEAMLFGEPLAFQFDTALLYNEGASAVVHELELVTLAGRSDDTRVALSYTDDGLTWGQERFSGAGNRGNRGARPAWRRLGRMAQWRGFRFRGIAKGPVAFARLEARLEPLNG